jgi:Family of unknown function (DUF6101)
MLAPRPESGETLKLEAADPRADNCRRTVSLSRDLVVIARQRNGVLMRIALRARAYLGVLMSLVGYEGGEFQYQVRLAHRDPELGVTLYAGADRVEADAAWRSWARFVGAPALVEREQGRFEEVPISGRPRKTGLLRRRARGVGARRPRFLARRRMGDLRLAVKVENEQELFGAWREGM